MSSRAVWLGEATSASKAAERRARSYPILSIEAASEQATELLAFATKASRHAVNAISSGWMKTVSRYVAVAEPSPFFVQAFVVLLREMPCYVARLRGLDIEPGPRLLFTVRTGRPPKERPSWEGMTVKEAIDSGSEARLASCLETGNLKGGDWKLIAQAFDPNSNKTKYKLVFKKNRPRRGNSITDLRADLKMNTLLVASEQLKKNSDSTGAKSCHIPTGLREMGLQKTDDDTQLKKARRRHKNQTKASGIDSR